MKIGTVAELRQRMSSQEFEDWKVYHGIVAQYKELARQQAGG